MNQKSMEVFQKSFPFMKNIYYDNKDFVERVKKQRESIYYSDKRLLNDNKIIYNYDEWNEIPDGRFTVKHKDYRFDCVFHRKQGPLFVILNGALFGKIPEFKRWSYYNFLQGSMLNIADPMYYKYKGLKLGWYYGDEENNLREYLSDVILKVSQMLGLSKQEIVILGSSGGGSAAIQTGALIKGSTVVAINSQIKLSLYYYHKTFSEFTGIDLCKEDQFQRNDTIVYLEPDKKLSTKFILIENINSLVDRNQIDHLLSMLPVKPKYGISQYGNITFWLYDAIASGKGGAHGAQEYHQIFYAILFLVNCVMSGVAIDECESLFLIFSEIWNDHFYLLEEAKKTKNIMNREIEAMSLNLPVEVLKKNEAVVNLEGMKIMASKEEKFRNEVINDNLNRNTLYCLYIARVQCITDGTDKFTILLRDKKENLIYARKDIEFGNDIKYFFMTSCETDDIELRVYCGKPAHTEGKGIYIEGLRLICLTAGEN